LRCCLTRGAGSRAVRSTVWRGFNSLHVDGFDVPDEFVLLLSGHRVTQESKYKVVWRFNQELGARFIGIVWQGMD
jgi:hypothetical protein